MTIRENALSCVFSPFHNHKIEISSLKLGFNIACSIKKYSHLEDEISGMTEVKSSAEMGEKMSI